VSSETHVLFPKYTSAVGTAGGKSYYTPAWDVSRWKTVSATVLLEAAFSTTTVNAQLEESADQETWSGIGVSTSLTAGNPVTLTKTDPLRYLRLKVSITGADKMATFWAFAVLRSE